MQKFEYIISDPIGIHARPAGLIVKKANEFESEFILSCNGKHTDLRRLMNLLALGVKKGDHVLIEVDGNDEASAKEAMQELFQTIL